MNKKLGMRKSVNRIYPVIIYCSLFKILLFPFFFGIQTHDSRHLTKKS